MTKQETMMNILGNGTKFKGNAKIAGSLRIDGEFEGGMTVSETLIIGKTGKIKGDIKTKNSIIGGYINGNLKTDEKVELQSGAKFEGDLICKKLIVEEGVTFDGNCKMSETKPAIEQQKPKHQERI
ncbi:polymer-forming cytoskeletal protein [candidate division WOR-3 bacterium]|nr:polymer-forming cytoskeletal protein [candidate division WOR-3 bacterium]